jgi:hypothetical protein
MAEPSTHIEAQVGNVSGGSQVAIGNYIVQIGRVEGGVVNILTKRHRRHGYDLSQFCFVPNHFRICSIEKRKAPLSFNHSTRSSLSSAVANRVRARPACCDTWRTSRNSPSFSRQASFTLK